MQVLEVMQRDVVTVQASDSLALAAQIMLWRRIRHLPVMRDGQLVGVLSERQLVSERGGLSAADGTKAVEEWMTAPAITIEPNEPLGRASALMVAHTISSLPVVERGELVGIITSTDLLAELSFEQPPAEDTVAAVATRRMQVVTPEDYVLDAVERMVKSDIRHLPVVDGKRRLVGMVSDRDVRTAVGDPLELMSVPERMSALGMTRVSELMVPNPSACTLDTPLDEVVEAFRDLSVGALPVVKEGDVLVGIVSYVDLLHAMVLRRRRR